MATTFPPTQAWDRTRNVISFPADVDNRQRVQCAISRQTLEEAFDIDPKLEALEGFRNVRGEVERVAERVIRRHRVEADGTVVIRTEDCRSDSD